MTYRYLLLLLLQVLLTCTISILPLRHPGAHAQLGIKQSYGNGSSLLTRPPSGNVHRQMPHTNCMCPQLLYQWIGHQELFSRGTVSIVSESVGLLYLYGTCIRSYHSLSTNPTRQAAVQAPVRLSQVICWLSLKPNLRHPCPAYDGYSQEALIQPTLGRVPAPHHCMSGTRTAGAAASSAWALKATAHAC